MNSPHFATQDAITETTQDDLCDREGAPNAYNLLSQAVQQSAEQRTLVASY